MKKKMKQPFLIFTLFIAVFLLFMCMSNDRRTFTDEDEIRLVMDIKLQALKAGDYDLYMDTVTDSDVLYFNEQERWFMEMTSGLIKNIAFEVLNVDRIDETTLTATIRQQHDTDRHFDFNYTLLFNDEDGVWKDCGYDFSVIETDRYALKYMEGERRVDEFMGYLDDAYDNLEGVFTEKPTPNYQIKLYTDRELLRQRTIPTNGWLFTGWAEPDESLKIYTGHPEDYKGYPGVMQHELVHNITINICNNNLPVWLLEGVAMYYGSGFYDHSHSSTLSNMDMNGIRMTIDELENTDLGADLPTESIRNFYNASYMYVEYLVETYGHDRFMELFYLAGEKPFHDNTLNPDFYINNNRTADEVLEDVLGLTKEELSDDYSTWLGRQ